MMAERLPERKVTNRQKLLQPASRCTDNKLAQFALSKGLSGFAVSELISAGLSRNKNAAKQLIWKGLQVKILAKNGRTRPQRYYSSSIIADVYHEKVTNDPTGAGGHASIKVRMKALEMATYSWIESNVLHMLPGSPQYIHNLNFKVLLSAEWLATDFYSSLPGQSAKGNKAKEFSNHIGGHFVRFLIYPNGTVMIHTQTSREPHRIETAEDQDALNRWLGRIEQALNDCLSCQHSNIVPPASEWIVTRSDINIDIEVPHQLQIYGPDLQWKYYGHFFRLYVKSRGAKTVMRSEASQCPMKPMAEHLSEAFTIAGLEKRITGLEDQLAELSRRLPA